MSTTMRVVVLVVVATVIGLLLWAVRDVLGPFVSALVLAYVLRPIVGAIRRRTGLPRPMVVLAVFIALLVIIVGGIVLLVPAITREARGLVVTLPRLLLSLRRLVESRGTLTVMGFEVDLGPVTDEVTRSLLGLATSTSRHIVDTVVATVETLLKTVLTLVISFYILVDFGRFRRALKAALPPGARDEVGAMALEVDRVLGGFLRAEVVLVLIMSSVTWVALTVLGIRYALVLAILAGVLELIPFIGPILAGVPAVLLALVLPSPFGWPPLVNAGVVAATYFVLRHAEDYFVIPHVVGRAVELHPLLAMFAAFSGLRLGGVMGMFLGVPLMAVLRVLLVYLYHKLVPAWEPEPDSGPAAASATSAAPVLATTGPPAPAAAPEHNPSAG